MLSLKRIGMIAACCLAVTACLPFEVQDTPPVYGVALDSKTSAPLANAQIRLVPQRGAAVAKSVITDSAGRFQIEPISHQDRMMALFPRQGLGGYQNARLEAAARELARAHRRIRHVGRHRAVAAQAQSRGQGGMLRRAFFGRFAGFRERHVRARRRR